MHLGQQFTVLPGRERKGIEMKCNSLRSVLVCFIAVAAGCSGGKPATYTIAFKPEPGTKVGVLMSMNQDIKQTVQGVEADTKQVMEFGFLYDVKQPTAEGNTVIDVVYKYIHLKQEIPSMNVVNEYDSTSKEEPSPAAIGFAALKDAKMTLIMSPGNEVLEVRGIDEMIDGMVKKVPVPDYLKDALVAQLKEQFSEESMKETFASSFQSYPKTPLKIGDTWTASEKVDAGFPMTVTTQNKLVSVENGIAVIEVDGKIVGSSEGKGLEDSPVPGNISVTGEQKGTIKVDLKTGLPVDVALKQNFSGEVEFNGEKMPIKSMSDITIKKVDPADIANPHAVKK